MIFRVRSYAYSILRRPITPALIHALGFYIRANSLTTFSLASPRLLQTVSYPLPRNSQLISIDGQSLETNAAGVASTLIPTSQAMRLGRPSLNVCCLTYYVAIVSSLPLLPSRLARRRDVFTSLLLGQPCSEPTVDEGSLRLVHRIPLANLYRVQLDYYRNYKCIDEDRKQPHSFTPRLTFPVWQLQMPPY